MRVRAGVLIGCRGIDARPAARVGLALLWPVGPAAFVVTLAVLVAASLIAFPIVGAIVLAAALAWLAAGVSAPRSWSQGQVCQVSGLTGQPETADRRPSSVSLLGVVLQQELLRVELAGRGRRPLVAPAESSTIARSVSRR